MKAVSPQALAFLREVIAHTQAEGHASLPGLRALWKSSELGWSALGKATRALVASGELISVPGRGLFLPGTYQKESQDLSHRVAKSISFTSSSSHRRLRSSRLAEYLYKEMLQASSSLSTTEFSPRDLSRRYGGSLATWRKLLVEQEAKGILQSRGHQGFSYDPRLGKSAAMRSEIWLLGLVDKEGRFWIFSDALRLFVRHLESQCASAGLRLRMLPINPRRLDFDLERLKEMSPPLGAILWLSDWVFAIKAEAWIADWVQQFSTLIKRPLAIWDDTGKFLSEQAYGKDVQLFRAETQPGADVAQYFVQRGHRALLFISPFANQSWSAARWKGLRDAIANHTERCCRFRL